MWFVGIGCILLILKWADIEPVATWSWWSYLWPFAAAVVWWWWADFSGYYQRKAMEKLDRKKEARRLKNLTALGLNPRSRGRR